MTHEIAFSLGHDLLTFVSSAVIAVMALFMLGVGVPRAPQWKAYRRMRAMLAVAYMLLAASGFATSMVQLEEGSPEWLSAVTLVVASLQALMFTATTVAFVSPLSVGLRWLLPQFLGITVCGAALIGTLACMPSLFPVAFWTFAACYAAQLAIYSLFFRRCFVRCVQRLEAHYDDDESGRLKWIVRCFCSALGIGVLALVFSVFSMGIGFYDCFVGAYTAYYVYMVHCMVNYRIDNSFVVKVVAEPEPAAAPTADAAQPGECASESIPDECEKTLAEALQRWQEEKMYTRKDVSPDEIAAQLGTTRRYLVWYFTNRLHTTLRSWRLKLRIAEAERLLREDPGVSVAALHEMVGVGDRSNFHKHFRQATGLTPSEYKARYGLR